VTKTVLVTFEGTAIADLQLPWWLWARFETLGQRCNVYMATVQADQFSDTVVGRGKTDGQGG